MAGLRRDPSKQFGINNGPSSHFEASSEIMGTISWGFRLPLLETSVPAWGRLVSRLAGVGLPLELVLRHNLEDTRTVSAEHRRDHDQPQRQTP